MLRIRRTAFGGLFVLSAFTASAAAAGPSLELDLTYSDRFPKEEFPIFIFDYPFTLMFRMPVDVKTWLDNTHGDGDESNADMGNSATVIAGTKPSTRAFLHFRVYPGPSTDTADPFFDRHGGDFLVPDGTWARAQMDTAETGAGVAAGTYATYLHEDEGGIEQSAAYKLIPDGVLTPGSWVEYFFSADTGIGTPETVVPDTTGGSYLEFQALPGFFVAGGDMHVPCLLYIDAADDDGQTAIEEFGLAPYLGSVTDDNGVEHDGWDRYDYTNATSPLAAPLGRYVWGQPLNGDNGMLTVYSLAYENILYDTGTHSEEGVREPDADLLINWLTTDDYRRDDVTKGLWLSGNGMASILQRVGHPDANLLLAGFAEASLVCEPYRDPGCGGGADGNSSYCVRLDPAPLADFGTAVTYASVTRNGAPHYESFSVLEPGGNGEGNLSYVDQDDGEPATEFASISADELEFPNPYGVVLDGFSLSRLRRVPDGFTGGTAAECGVDSTAITTRVDDVLSWFGVPAGSECAIPEAIDVDDPSSTPSAHTVLFQNTPNPFNPQTSVRYELAESARVTFTVYDVHGALVRTLVDEQQAPDRYAIRWDGTDDTGDAVASGVYWARLTTSTGFTGATKMVVLK